MSTIDPIIEFEKIIKRLEYPNSRTEIIDAVRTHGKSDALVQIAETLPQQSFTDPSEVMSAVKI